MLEIKSQHLTWGGPHTAQLNICGFKIFWSGTFLWCTWGKTLQMWDYLTFWLPHENVRKAADHYQAIYLEFTPA